MALSLYELAADYQGILDLADDPDVDTQAIKDTLEAIDAAIEVKVDNGIGLLQSLISLEHGIDSEIKRLQTRKKAVQSRIQSIKDWYKQNLERIGKSKVQTKRGTMSVQSNPPALIIDDADQVPIEFKFTVPSRMEIDKDMLKEALKRGDDIDGAHIERSRSLRIK